MFIEPNEALADLAASPSLAQIAALNAAVVAADQALEAAHSRQAENRALRQGLETRLAAERAAEPPALADLDASLVAALIADPTAECCPKAVAETAKRHAALRVAGDQWTTRVNLARQAIGQVDADAVAIGEEIAGLTAQRETAWQAFLIGAHDYLVAEFFARTEALRTEVYEAMVNLEHLEINGRRLLNYRQWRVRHGSQIILSRSVERPGITGAIGDQPQEVTVFTEPNRVDLHKPTPAIERFRATLPGLS